MKKQAQRKMFKRAASLLLVLIHLFMVAACAKEQPDPTVAATEETVPAATEPVHTHVFTEGVCECGESNGMGDISLEVGASLLPVTREDSESGATFTSDNPAGEVNGIRLQKEIEVELGRYYEMNYVFTSNVAGTVRFTCEGAAYYESNEYEVAAGENEIAVRFAVGKTNSGKVNTNLELGGLDKFSITMSSVNCVELEEDLSDYFLDIAPEKASGTMEMTADGDLALKYQTNEGWRVKLAIDRVLVKGKTYETTFVFTRTGGRDQNVTYTVYDGAATVIGSRTKLVDNDLCIATFYLTANETVTKGTCLELGQLCDGEDVSLIFTYIDFEELDEEKLEKLMKETPFPGIYAWTEGALIPAVATQSAEGLTLVNTNPATDWWKVKLEQNLPAHKGEYYRVTFKFASDVAGKIKFVNDGANYYGSNEYTVKKGDNIFTVELKSGGNSYSCLELGGLGPCELMFTDIAVEEIDKPTVSQNYGSGSQTPAKRFGSFKAWTDSSVKALKRSDTTTTMTLTSQNEPTDWWKVKLEKDINGTAGQWYEVKYTFTSDATGRIKFVNDGAEYYGANEYDVAVGENTFAVKFQYNGKPYSCLELGGLGQFKLIFTDYSIKKIEAPEIINNGFENYKAWTEGSMKALTREDTADSMTLISENAAGDWWKVKLENNFELEPGKTYEASYTFTSDAEGDIKFGTNENVTCLSADVYHVTAGENTFKVTFTTGADPYTCLELGGLGEFTLTFTDISLKEVVQTEEPDQPEDPTEHTHSFVNGKCTCGASNGFENYKTWAEASVKALKREDTQNAMTLISENAAGDWWKVKLENNFALTAGKTYEAVYSFTSNAEGDIKFGTNENVTCLSADVYHVTAGENTFKVTFTAGADPYTCLELGGLGEFTLTFTDISLKEVVQTEEPDQPEDPTEHTHSFVNGKCECGATNGFAGVNTWTEGALIPLTREDTENTMILTSENGPADWWKVKVEPGFALEEGKTYEATFNFTSNVAGTIKFNVDGASYLTANEYAVQAGANTFTVSFTAGSSSYNCLELGGLGQFTLTFTDISLKEVETPAEPETPEEPTEPEDPSEHTHSFVNGKCECGATNGFAGVNTWTEGALIPLTREDTENTMILTSENGPADWWKVKVEPGFAVQEGKTYEATFNFTSNVAGTIKFNVDGASYLTANEYAVQAGANTFTVSFTAGSSSYNCLELGGLGQFTLTFTDISLKEVEKPAEPETPEEPTEPEDPSEHTHSFVNGKCECGATNGFAGVNIWTEGALIPLTREDTENTMILTSENGPADWWKVKVEPGFALEEGKTYEATFNFTSNVAGTIKFNVDGASYLTANEYAVQAGTNTFTVSFTAGSSSYNCLELGGLGNFKLTFTGISLKEVEMHTHSFVNGKCECGATNGFAGVNTWTEGSLIPVIREDTENSMTVISENAAGDWWKVKVEPGFALQEGKSYEATFRFSSNAAGTIKFNVDGASYLTANEYAVQTGGNTFTVSFTAGSSSYNCLELGGLGAFRLTFIGISLKEVEQSEPECTHEYLYECSTDCKLCQETTRPEVTHTYENGVCKHCSAPCSHSWTDGACTVCQINCSHEETETTSTVTCGASGKETVTCKTCHKVLSEIDKDATGEHSYTDGICTVCGGSDPNYVPPAGEGEGGKGGGTP